MSRQALRAAARHEARVAPAASPPTAAAQDRQRPREGALENLALGLLSGILLAAPFLVPALWWVHYIALVPWILLVTRDNQGSAWLYFFAGAYTFYVMACPSCSRRCTRHFCCPSPCCSGACTGGYAGR